MTTTATLPTQNAAWGFFGTCETAGLDAQRAWDIAFTAIQDATGARDPNAFGPDAVRLFLDSRGGRHFADEVRNQLHDGLDLEAAIVAATKRHMAWKIGRQTQRDTGIPAGLPYLTGWIQHHAIEAEMNET